jgi:pimeloyl-ACP methyl ester carboxylesterase
VPERSNDLIVVIPGILGSVLQRDGREIWNHSFAAMRHGLPPRRLVQALALHQPGNVRATSLINGLHIVPGLWGIDGYGTLLARLARVGEVITFPYDWRLSNAINAEHLEKAMARNLRPGRRAVFVCHSMGGLLARYYLEVLGGREIARRLITIGTPHQGAAKAAVALSLGLVPEARSRLGPAGKVLDDLRAVASTFPSMYELLPTYRCVDFGNGHMTNLADAQLPGIHSAALNAGVEFHRKLAEAVIRNGPATYETHMFGGHRHRTILSIRCDASGIGALRTWNGEDPRGDGTVPRFAAVTAESESDTLVRYSGERHSALARARHVGDAVHALLTAQPVRKYQAPELELSLDLPELVELNATLKITAEADSDRLALMARATHDESATGIRGPVLHNEGDGLYSCELSLPRPGAWRVTLSTSMPTPIEPVTEIVVAANPDST